MSVSLSALRAYLVADQHDVPLPSPQPLNLATDTVSYGSTVRLELDVTADEPMLPLDCEVRTAGAGGSLGFFPVRDTATFAAEVRLPWGAFCHATMDGVTSPPRLPLASSPAAAGMAFEFSVREHGEAKSMTPPQVIQGWPSFPGGSYTLYISAWSLRGAVEGSAPVTVDATVRISAPPGSGGSPPRIVRLDGGRPDAAVLVGQPWLLTASVQDDDNDVVAVIFCSHHGGYARFAPMKDDGSCGDERPHDGVYSFLRVGKDAWDAPAWSGSDDVPVTVSVQAVDLRGNWSEPAQLAYRLCYSQHPIWAAKPDPGGPHIVEAGVGRAEGLPSFPRIWARCDTKDAWVCARVVPRPEQAGVLFDDGKGPDAVAGDLIHSNFAWFSPDFWFSRYTRGELVLYAVPKSGPPRTGRRMAVSRPPVP